MHYGAALTVALTILWLLNWWNIDRKEAAERDYISTRRNFKQGYWK